MLTWKPFFTPDILRRFEIEIPDHPQGAGRGGIKCPHAASEQASWLKLVDTDTLSILSFKCFK